MAAENSGWRPLSGNEDVDCAAIDQQLDLAQTDYDPSGAFYTRRDLSFMFALTRDTTDLDVPAIYKSKETSLVAHASAMPNEDIGVSLMVQTPDTKDRYSSREDSDIPSLVELLGRIAHVELAEFETRPRNALNALSQLDPKSYSAFGRRAVQRTYDPERTETDAVHLTVIQMEDLNDGDSSAEYHINFGRPLSMEVQGEKTNFTYWQHFEGKNDNDFLQNPRAFLELRRHPLGAEFSTKGPAYCFELADAEWHRKHNREFQPQGHKEIAFSEFEGLLQLAGNTYVGPVTGGDINRITCEPLDASLRLHL